jgi:AdoMet-dependent heme synthase
VRSKVRSPNVRFSGFDQAPFITFWEITRACDLACKHCRASAMPQRDPSELDHAQGLRLLENVAGSGCPVVVLTGGDPAKREDLVELVRYGTSLGLRMCLTPSATPLVTRELLIKLRDAGLSRLAVSLDGADAAAHDDFRGVQGSFARTFEILRDAKELGLTTQINTSITHHNRDQLETIAKLIGDLGIELWSVFFVVPTGRGTDLDLLQPDLVESLLQRLAAISEHAPFDVKTTAAPQFRRVLLQRKVKREHITGISDGIGRAPRGVNDGQGIAFISHRGEVSPSGFLPIVCGTYENFASVYREHPLFVSLRDTEHLEGKCGVCEFRKICGGSRARAFALSHDVLAHDPACAYLPKQERMAG